MNSVLDYFISLQESQSADMNEQSVEMWNRRAEFWENARKKNQKGNERVVSAINYLEQKGLLDKNYDVADIGCGPGRFVAAFARHVHKVVGLDISDKMISHGMEHIQKEGLSNACLYVCDFQKLDIEKAGYKHAFDLVFSSMTPALHGMNGLMKSIDKFDTHFEVKFSTYAVPLIAGEIKRFLRDDGMVKVSRTLKENGIRIKRAAEMLAIRLGRDATLEELSAATELAREDIVMALEAGSEVESLHKTVFQKEGSEILLMDKIPSKKNESEHIVNQILLEQLLGELGEKERKLIELRYYEDKTQTQTAKLLDMSQVQVSRLEKKIIGSMRKHFVCRSHE